LRLSDCAGIYTWTSSSGTPEASFTARAMVRNNVVVGVYTNNEGCGTYCENLGTGFYLDEMTSGVTLQNNVVSNAEIGIALHNAHFNVIESNVVRKAVFSSIRCIQTRSNNAMFTGNKFQNNFLESNKVMAVSNGLPVEKTLGHAFYWFHPSNPQSMFASNGNVVKGNKILSAQQGSEVTWGLATWTTGSIFKTSDWKAYASTDAAVSPIAYRGLLANTETNLVSNGDFNPTLGAWTTYFDPSVTGGSFKMGNFPACGSATCGRHVAASTGDQLLSGSFKLDTTSGQNVYVFRMTAIGGSTDGTRTIGLRRATSPWDNYGLGFKVNVPAGQTVEVEQFFQAKSADPGILDLRSSVGTESYTRGVSVSRVTSVELMPRSKLEVNVINPTATTLSFPCTALNLSTCDAVDEAGNKIGWPLVVPARGSMQVYARDTKWKY
jgi:parallel beta-helix repeat protein